jgi:hypothetical protein
MAAVLMVIVSALATALSSPRRGFELLGGDAACDAEEDLLNGADRGRHGFFGWARAHALIPPRP